jgi:hypothetical protein
MGVDELCRLVEDSGLEVNETRSLVGSVKFPSVDALLHTEIQATPLAEQIEDARHVLARFVESSGAVTLPVCAWIVSATRPESADSD